MTGAVWWSLALLLLVPELPGAGPAPVPPPAEPWSVRAEDRRLVRAARRAAGVWAGPHAPDPVFAHTVVVTASTLAYGAFLRNWVCRAEALHMWYLVVALDAPLYRALARGADPVGPVRYPALGPGAALALFDVERRRNLTAGAVSGAFHEFRGGRFNDLSCGKVRAVAHILRAGLHVLFLDADVGILSVPLALIPTDGHCHYAYQADLAPRRDVACNEVGGTGNTGVYWARNSSEMVRWFFAVEGECRAHPDLDDQENFWQVFRRVLQAELGLAMGNSCGTPNPKSPYVCALSPCVAPNGYVQADPVPRRLLERLQGRAPVVVHPNFVSGGAQKRAMLRNLSLWVGDGPDQCSAKRARALSEAWGPQTEGMWLLERAHRYVTPVARRSHRLALVWGRAVLVAAGMAVVYWLCKGGSRAPSSK